MRRPFTGANALRRALRDLERQASALQSQTTATAEPVASIGFGLPRACVVPAEPQALPGATWAKRWLEPPGDRPSLFAYPGHQAASIQEQPYIGVGYVLNMSAPSEIELAVGTVTALVQEQRNFTPLFICTSTHFVPFLRHGYAFEYLPPRDQFGGDDAAYLLWRRRRLAFIAAKWGLSSVTELGAPPTALAEAQPQLIYFPDYGDSNPYQQIMYADVQESWQVAPGAIETAIAATRRGPTIFHLHWEDAVGRDSADPAAAMATFVRDIDLLRQRGGLFVWTIHNLEPHDAPDPALSRAFAQQLLSRADLVHVHHSSNAEDIGGTVGLQTEIITVAHPGYPPSEPVARSAARRQLGWQTARRCS